MRRKPDASGLAAQGSLAGVITGALNFGTKRIRHSTEDVMTRIHTMLFASAAIAAVAACAPKAGPVDTSADVAALNAVQVRELAAVGSANADSLGAVFTADALLLPPGEAAVNGTDAVRKWFEGMVKDNTFTGKYTESKLVWFVGVRSFEDVARIRCS